MKHHAEYIPEEFAYLREAVARFGHLSHHEVILDFLENKTDEQMALLREVGEQIRDSEHHRRIVQWSRRIGDLAIAVDATLSLIGELGIPTLIDYAAMPAEEARAKLRREWAQAEPYEYCWLAEQTREFFNFDEGREIVVEALANARRKDKPNAVMALYSFPTAENVSLVADYWRGRHGERRPKYVWGTLVALSGVDWPTLRQWLSGDDLLRDVAIDALKVYCFDREVPTAYGRPKLPGYCGADKFVAFLDELLPQLQSDWQRKWVTRLIDHAEDIGAA